MGITGQGWLPGFLLSGFLLALPGALLPAWGYHLAADNNGVALCFFSVWAGVFLANQFSLWLPPFRIASPWWLTVSFLAVAIALAALASISPATPNGWELLAWGISGFAAGLLNTSLFQAMEPLYRKNPASTVTWGGIYFGLGCLLSALLVASSFTLFSVREVLWAATVVPLSLTVLSFRRSRPAVLPSEPATTLPAFQELLRPGAALFLLLLVVQSGNEWAVAGWLSLFLIHRLGVSPEAAVWVLALYWFGLLGGRILTVFLLSFFRHGRLLAGSAMAALLGCLLLVLTNNTFGAVCGILLVGFGFAAIYPLLAEKAGGRFPARHPTALHTMFSLAVAGGMAVPGALGVLVDEFGLWVVMSIPALGTFVVVLLLLLIWLQSKVTGR